MQISVKIDDKKVKVSLKKLGDAIPKLTNKVMHDTMNEAKFVASGGYTGGASYEVPPKFNSKYQRTGTYGASFKVVKYQKLSFRMYSDAVQHGRHYTTYVGGDARGSGQLGMHKITGWANIFNVVTSYAQKLVKRVELSLKDYLRKEGMGL